MKIRKKFIHLVRHNKKKEWDERDNLIRRSFLCSRQQWESFEQRGAIIAVIAESGAQNGNTSVAPRTLASQRHLLPNDTCSPNSWGCRRESECGWERRWRWRCRRGWRRDREWVSVLIGAWSGPREKSRWGATAAGASVMEPPKMSICFCIANVFSAILFCAPALSLRDCREHMGGCAFDLCQKAQNEKKCIAVFLLLFRIYFSGLFLFRIFPFPDFIFPDFSFPDFYFPDYLTYSILMEYMMYLEVRKVHIKV
jgi:hypothetical protein